MKPNLFGVCRETYSNQLGESKVNENDEALAAAMDAAEGWVLLTETLDESEIDQ